MNDDEENPGPPDPWADRLIALLYDELPSGEAQAVRREIDGDPGLRRAWDEIRTAREALGALAPGESGPAVARAPAGAWVSERPGGRLLGRNVPPPSRPRPSMRSLVFGSAWGLAAAALLVLVLGLARFRVEWVEHGLAFSAGTGRGITTVATKGAPGPGAGAAASAVPAADSTPASELSFVTHDDLRVYTAEISRGMAALLDERTRRRDMVTAAWLQVAFEEMSRRQAHDYGDLRYRIEQVGIGLAQGQYRANEQIDCLLRLDGREQPPPALVPVTEEGDTP
jgi:hypothetical protein